MPITLVIIMVIIASISAATGNIIDNYLENTWLTISYSKDKVLRIVLKICNAVTIIAFILFAVILLFTILVYMQ